jgi:hypothetical protein
MADNKVKDFQPPYQEERDGFSTEDLAEGLDRPSRSEIEEITAEGIHRDPNGVLRRTLRGDESKGDPDERDRAGATACEDTAHGREETKNDNAAAANQTG